MEVGSSSIEQWVLDNPRDWNWIWDTPVDDAAFCNSILSLLFGAFPVKIPHIVYSLR